MSGQKQSFRFRLPWLPSLVSAPGRSSLSQRSRKTPPPPSPVDSVGMNMIPIQRQVEEVESESPVRTNWPLARPESDKLLPKRDPEPHQPPQLNQQQSASLLKRTDSQSPGKDEAAAREESSEFHIHLSGTDSNPLQLSSTSSAPVQTTPDQSGQAIKSQEAESQHLRETQFLSPPATKSPPRSPTGESKLLSPFKGAKLTQQKLHLSKSSSSSSSTSSSSSPPQKPSPTRAKSKPQSPSQTGTLTQANSKASPDAGNHTRSSAKKPSPDAGNQPRSKQPSSDAGNHTRSSAKQLSPDAGIHTGDADTRTTSLSPVPSHTVKPAKTSSKLGSSSSSSPPYSPSSQSSTSSYLIGVSLNSSTKQLTSSPTPKNSSNAHNSMPQTHASQEMKHESTLPQEETNLPNATKTTDLEAIRANESNTAVTVNDKKAPEPSHTRFMEHPNPGTKEASESEEDKSRKSARKKRKRKLFLKRVSPRENGPMALNSHKDEGESNTIPLHEEIKNDVLNFTEKLRLGKLGQYRSEDRAMNIITISGDNKGATLHLNGKAPRQVTVANSDTDGTKSEGPLTKYEQQKWMTCINSNIQSINNALLLNSSVHERNPGVHFGTIGNNTKSAPAGLERYEHSSTDDVHEKEVTFTTARKLEYNRPIVKRRCLRGLLMESSESEADNPDKSRRHGCRVACGHTSKYDF